MPRRHRSRSEDSRDSFFSSMISSSSDEARRRRKDKKKAKKEKKDKASTTAKSKFSDPDPQLFARPAPPPPPPPPRAPSPAPPPPSSPPESPAEQPDSTEDVPRPLNLSGPITEPNLNTETPEGIVPLAVNEGASGTGHPPPAPQRSEDGGSTVPAASASEAVDNGKHHAAAESTGRVEAEEHVDEEGTGGSVEIDIAKELRTVRRVALEHDDAADSVLLGGGDNYGADDDDDDDGADGCDDWDASELFAAVQSKAAAFQAAKKASDEELRHRSDVLVTELLKAPTSSSLSLTIAGANAADERMEMTAAVAKVKAPAPTAEDAKKIIKLQYVDHSLEDYRPFEKDFYLPPLDVKAMTEAEITALLEDLDGAVVRGKEIPRPMKTWDGTGLPESLLATLAEHKFASPFAVQCIGIPVLMSGRDLLVSAKTGSGKTLMYVLPIVRHAMNQKRCERGEGPIALILLPTQELADQVASVVGIFAPKAHLRVTHCHGGVPLSDNIKACKAGCDIMIAVPGRLLDLLTLNSGRVLNFSRVTFVVVDEVDRMFDSGFMEHTTAFLKNVRPDRQAAFVSATMPKQLKALVKEHLQHPIELTVGGRPTPASNVKQEFVFMDEQYFEVDADKRGPDVRLPRLLQLIHEMRSESQNTVMIFVQSKNDCNILFADLTRCGYRGKVALLYAEMDKLDRQFALERFSPTDQYVLVSSALGERGLDIAHLGLVVNYSMPDHYEAYVHRIGRTGRAGRSGHAVSFFVRGKDDEIAAELVDGLERAGQVVPEELYERAAIMRKKRQEGLAPARPTGFYRGYGAAHKTELTRDQNAALRARAREAGLEDDLSSDDNATDSSEDDGDDDDASRARRGDPDIVEETGGSPFEKGTFPSSTALVLHQTKGGGAAVARFDPQMAEKLAEARRFAESATDVFEKGDASKKRFRSEYPINDEPVFVRQRLQSAAALREIEGRTNTTIVKKGYYFDPKLKGSYKLREGDRPLYLLIHGYTVESVRTVFRELDNIKKEAKSKEARKWSSIGAQL